MFPDAPGTLERYSSAAQVDTPTSSLFVTALMSSPHHNFLGQQSLDPSVSATPTLQNPPDRIPLHEKDAKIPKCEHKPVTNTEQPASQVEMAREVVSDSVMDDKGVLIIDWGGPDDPENPKK